MTRFSLAKIFAKGSYFVLGTKLSPNLISPIARVTFQEVVGGAHELLVCTYARVLMTTHVQIQCVKIFTMQKNSRKNFSPTACIGEIGKNFSWQNFYVYGTTTSVVKGRQWFSLCILQAVPLIFELVIVRSLSAILDLS